MLSVTQPTQGTLMRAIQRNKGLNLLSALPPISISTSDRLKAMGSNLARESVESVCTSQPPSAQGRMSEGEEWMEKRKCNIVITSTYIYVCFPI